MKIVEETDYPFSEAIQFKIALPRTTSFPLYLRVPRWCEAASLKINGKTVQTKARPLSFMAVSRQWKDGDTVTLLLPM